jgi:hypothetical protein
MNAEIIPVKTGAELAFAEAFAAAKARLPGDRAVAANTRWIGRSTVAPLAT